MNKFKYRIRNKLNKKKELTKFFKKKGYTRCRRCNRKLTNPDSMLKRYGKVCFIKENKITQLDLTFS